VKKTFKIIYYAVLTIIIFIALVFIVSVFPISGNIKILSVLSGSMEPKIHTGSIVIIKPASEYKVGDVVTFGQNTKTEVPTTHRIAEERLQDGNKVFLTKGDANNAEDNKEISEKDIIGKVFVSVPYVGYIIDFIKKPVGLLIVIVIPAVIIVYDQIQNISKEIKKMMKKRRTKSKTDEKENSKNDFNGQPKSGDDMKEKEI